MARRRRQTEQAGGTERWLVSYADFITLLFAFFVVMYAISSVNDNKYRVLSESLTGVFDEPPRSELPIQVGEVMRNPEPLADDRVTVAPIEPVEPVEPEPEPRLSAEEIDRLVELRETMDALEQRLGGSLEHLTQAGKMDLRRTSNGIELEMTSQMLFGSGSTRLAPEALRALRDVAQVIAGSANSLVVEGHTDDIPISTAQFPSNWELSAARAASVVHYFTRLGIAPERLAAVGYGEFRPRADNATEAGRARNRRVVLVIKTPAQEGEDGAAPAPAGTAGEVVLPWAEAPAEEAWQ